MLTVVCGQVVPGIVSLALFAP
uniref:Uncharacterized protein n=1 Tax=Arundo donax TaxID=35708 RepID=A0A0A9CB16_ARUDO